MLRSPLRRPWMVGLVTALVLVAAGHARAQVPVDCVCPDLQPLETGQTVYAAIDFPCGNEQILRGDAGTVVCDRITGGSQFVLCEWEIDNGHDGFGACACPLGGGTEPVAVAVTGAAFATSPRNDRTRVPFVATLEPGRRYRLVASVIEWRPTAPTGPAKLGGLLVEGGLLIDGTSPCDGPVVASAAVDPTRRSVTARVRFGAAPLAGDLDGDGREGPADLARLLDRLGETTGAGAAAARADLDRSGTVDVLDVLRWLEHHADHH